MVNTNRIPTAPGAPLRVFIVEDSPAVLDRLEKMLESISGAGNAGHADTAVGAIDAILESHPDAVVLDIGLAQGSGFDVLRAVHEKAPDIDFYVLSNYTDAPYRRLAERLGASGFFDKSTQIDSMRDLLVSRAATTIRNQRH
jgi:DNA-binding NarL/FixJ family response regulator